MGRRRNNNVRPIRGKGLGPKNVELDYKRPETLKQYLDDFGRIRPRRQTRLDGRAQRILAREVKKARHLALLPFIER